MGKLVDEARSGQPEAFDLLMALHQEQVTWHCRRYLDRDDDIEDVVQTTFLNAHRAIRRYEPRCTFGSWLKRIASNACIDLLRQRNRKPELLPVDFQDSDAGRSEIRVEWGGSCGDPEHELERLELSAALEESLAQLPPRLNEAFRLREFSGLAYNEIADTLGVSLGVVKSRIYYARQALMKSLAAFKP